jgi:hypothetical protein
MNRTQDRHIHLAERLRERLRQDTQELLLLDEERQILLAALDLFVREQARTYTVLIRMPATSRTPQSEKRYVTRSLRRWYAYWQTSGGEEEAGVPELVEEERDEDAAGVFFELTFCVGRKPSAQEKQWLEQQPGVVAVRYVREDEAPQERAGLYTDRFIHKEGNA